MRQLTLAAVNPLDCGPDVKSLFTSHGDSRFADWFDRAYPLAVHRGATAWTGRSAEGTLKMYIARFDREFRLAGEVVRAGNLNNMFVAQDARTFFPALALVRRAIRDTRSEGKIDFLYGTPNARFAPISCAGGLQQVGVMARLVLPLGDKSAIKNALLNVLHLSRYATASTSRVSLEEYSGLEYHACGESLQVRSTSSLDPVRPQEMYCYRLDGYPSDTYRWHKYYRRGDGTPIATFLIELPRSPVATIRAHQIFDHDQIRSVIIDLASRLRRLGYLRLQATALTSSPLYRSLRRSGFFHRSIDRELHAIAITERGKEAVAVLGASEVEPIDCDQ